MTAASLRINGRSWLVYDEAGAAELRARLREPWATSLRTETACHDAWSDLYDEAEALEAVLVPLAWAPLIEGVRLDAQWARGVAVPPDYQARLANWTREWTYFKTTDCVDEIGLNVLVGASFVPPTVDIKPVVMQFYTPKTEAPPPPADIIPETDEEPPPAEPTGLTTGAKIAIGAVIAGGLFLIVRSLR